jgi:hypothetical protein
MGTAVYAPKQGDGMRSKSMFLLAVTGVAGICIILLTLSGPAKAASGTSRILAKSQFRITGVDPMVNGPTGDLLLIDEGGKQTVQVKIKKLNETDLGLTLSPSSFFDGTNSPTYYVSPIDRSGSSKGNWSRKLTGTNGAPPELQLLTVTNLSELSDVSSFDIGNPGSTNIVGGTNSIDLVCTVTNGISVCTFTTNIVGGVTNIYLNAFVWAPIPPLVSNPAVFNFRVKGNLGRPPVAPSPHATGSMLMTYNGNEGRSLLDIRANNLVKGQSYQLWVSDNGTNVGAGLFEFLNSPGGANAKFRRDTSKGDPLPIQVASVADLTNRVFQVQDGFGVVHLQFPPP